jgi:hypothetical protein
VLRREEKQRLKEVSMLSTLALNNEKESHVDGDNKVAKNASIAFIP